MKIAFVALCFVAVAAAIPTHRSPRDVSGIVAEPQHVYLPPAAETVEPQNIYLPPAEQVIAEAEPSVEEQEPEAEKEAPASEPAAVEQADVNEPVDKAVPETAVFGENGYEYRTVRKLRLRQRRDVSHLNLSYLPPVASPKLSNSYLPPHLDVPEELPQFKISNEYLPPLSEELPVEETATEVAETEATATEAPATEAPATEAPATEATATEAPATEAPSTTQAPSTTEDVPVESAVFAEDGYHYRKPAVLPDLGFAPLVKVAEPDAAPESAPVAEVQPEPVQEPEQAQEPESEVVQEPEIVQEPEQTIVAEPERAYLPPLEAGVVEAEGPEDETAALLDDGYHYRVVKRVRLF
ncbi:fibrous sheath CABYR-binding protein-like [Ceratitis capitata]|uniref:fibrous sheath CABYR-binding protein-like n=1 Tax=Ceratitis capitata TaxID=7213 RepID=UPI0006188873|nr:fibrous sheath CABYR-binding protein-like [Ceratitis capitata]